MAEGNVNPLRVVICWTYISGYMASCWQALSALGVDLHVVAFLPPKSASAPFDPEVMRGVPHTLISDAERSNPTTVKTLVKSIDPDLLVIPGWSVPAYRAIAYDPSMRSIPLVLTMDTPHRRDLRQFVARWFLRKLRDRASLVFVPGERAWQYAKALGFPEQKIRRRLYGINYEAFSAALSNRRAKEWPRRFLYTGRYSEEKGIDILVEGYQRYRSKVSDPWPLTVCGAGAERQRFQGKAGITDRGFIQPREQPALYAEHGCFVIASHYDPWPLVIAEACAAGLPICCTEACGSAVELVRSYYNGIQFATDDPEALAMSLKWMHQHYGELQFFGERSLILSEAFSAHHWARNWLEALNSLSKRS